jgi:hypothetical protein
MIGRFAAPLVTVFILIYDRTTAAVFSYFSFQSLLFGIQM